MHISLAGYTYLMIGFLQPYVFINKSFNNYTIIGVNSSILISQRGDALLATYE
jgi:hypothetical protein